MVHLNTLHMKKVIESSQGFGIWEETNEYQFKKELICEKCNYKASQISNLKRHLKTHDVEKKKKLTKCDKCDFTSEYPRNVKKHILFAKHKKIESKSTKSTKYTPGLECICKHQH